MGLAIFAKHAANKALDLADEKVRDTFVDNGAIKDDE